MPDDPFNATRSHTHMCCRVPSLFEMSRRQVCVRYTFPFFDWMWLFRLKIDWLLFAPGWRDQRPGGRTKKPITQTTRRWKLAFDSVSIQQSSSVVVCRSQHSKTLYCKHRFLSVSRCYVICLPCWMAFGKQFELGCVAKNKCRRELSVHMNTTQQYYETTQRANTSALAKSTLISPVIYGFWYLNRTNAGDKHQSSTEPDLSFVGNQNRHKSAQCVYKVYFKAARNSFHSPACPYCQGKHSSQDPCKSIHQAQSTGVLSVGWWW